MNRALRGWNSAGRSDVGSAYCWVPARADADQLTVAGQERWARHQADRLGVTIATDLVFADTNLTAWANGATPPGWRQMTAAARSGRFGQLFLYRAERLDEVPRAMAELVRIAGDHRIVVHGHPRDLTGAATREAIMAQADAESRRRQVLSVRSRAAGQARAAAGLPHGGGLRPYGYQTQMTAVIEAEAEVVRQVYAAYLAGATRRQIAVGLNQRGVVTAGGSTWTSTGITRLLAAPRYAGLRAAPSRTASSSAGQLLPAAWPACVPVEMWEQVQRHRQEEESARAAARLPQRFYPLTSLVVCARCERTMVGSMVSGYPTYACNSASSLHRGTCSRHIGAEPLEAHVADRAVLLLQSLGAEAAIAAPATASRRAPGGRSPRALHRDISTRPPGALDGVVTGPGAPFAWSRLPRSRQAVVLRYLFVTIRIAASSTGSGVFDPGRIDAIARPIGAATTMTAPGLARPQEASRRLMA